MSGGTIASIFAVSGEFEYPLTEINDVVEDGNPAEALPKESADATEDFSYEFDDPSANPDVWIYRERTVGLLKRYCRLSVEVGRLPSLLGREFFRSRVTSYHMSTFEDVVIFVHDVERSLEKLDRFEQRIIALIVLEEYSQEEVARILQCTDRTVRRHFADAVDRLTELFLRGGILKAIEKPQIPPVEKTCQEGEASTNFVSYCV